MPTVNLEWQGCRCSLLKELWWERRASGEVVPAVLTTLIRAEGEAKINDPSSPLAEAKVDRLSNAGREGRLCRVAIHPTNLVKARWGTCKILLNLCARRRR